MDHLWLRAEERGDLSAVLHPEYRRGVSKDSEAQNRQEGRRVEELAAELASQELILFQLSAPRGSHLLSPLKWWKAHNHCKKFKSPRQGLKVFAEELHWVSTWFVVLIRKESGKSSDLHARRKLWKTEAGVSEGQRIGVEKCCFPSKLMQSLQKTTPQPALPGKLLQISFDW